MIDQVSRAFFWPAMFFVGGWVLGGAKRFFWVFSGGPEPGFQWGFALACWSFTVLLLWVLVDSVRHETIAKTTWKSTKEKKKDSRVDRKSIDNTQKMAEPNDDVPPQIIIDGL